jgi:hypothetical protein
LAAPVLARRVTATGDAARRVLAVVLFLLVGVALVGVAAATGGAGPGDGGWAQTTPTNNSSLQHEHPDRSGGQGDTAGLQNWLSGKLTDGLEGSMIQLSEGEYDLARKFVSEEWRDRLGQYVDVAGETESDDDEGGDEFEQTAETQRNFTDALQEYRTVREKLEEARRRGNTTAVRRYAHQLEAIAQRVRRTNRTLVNRTRRLSTLTGVDTSRITRIATNLTRNVTRQQREIREAIFVETSLSVRSNRSIVSFSDPLGLEGRLTANNDTAVANESVTIRVGGRDIPVTTDPDGRFELTYRPVFIPIDRRSIPVSYVPAPTAPYLGTRTSVPVDEIVQVEPEINLTVSDSTYAYGDSVDAHVQLTVDGRAVSPVPLALSIDGVPLGEGVTAGDGSLELGGPLPATVPPGDRTRRLAVPWVDRAIGPGAVTEPVRIESTATNLGLDPTVLNESVRVSGTLETGDGRPLADRTVVLRLDGSQVGTLETDSAGVYSGTLGLEQSPDGDVHGNLTLVAAFSGEGTNLEGSSSRAVISVAPGRSIADGNPDQVRTVGLVLIGLVVLGVLLVGGRWWRRREAAAGEGSQEASGVDRSSPSRSDREREQLLVRRAQELLDQDAPQDSVANAYAAVRRHLESSLDLPANLTHREFLYACRDSLDGEQYREFATLANAYERLTFASSVSTTEAREALAVAERVLGE